VKNQNNMGDFVKFITEMIWGQSTLEMGFIRFFFTFVLAFVTIKAIIHFTTNKNDKE